jgi:ribonuclease J
MTSHPLEVVPLGGLGEFGKNVLWLKCGGSSVLVDVGVSFADEAFPGIDKIAPDLSLLRGEQIDAILLTHGHEDHIGALPLLREWCEAPVYGFPFTLALARRRLEETEVSTDRLVIAKERAWNRAGEFSFAYFRISHSVPDSAAIVIEAGGRRLFHSGDFKLDDDPPDGERTDREGIAAAVSDGVDLAFVDSTNAERRGHSLSERVAGRGIAAAFAEGRGRLILTTFSSHVSRLSQATEAALDLNRRVAFLGRSMRTVAEIAEGFGRLRLPAGARPAPNELRHVPADRLLCLISGSQGEPSSALDRLAQDEHPDLKIEPGDLVLFSSRTIPGHERSVGRVTDHLVRRGVRVLSEAEPPIHVSGHGYHEDIAELLALVKPRAVVPVHGERRMLAAAAGVALEAGIPPDAVHLLDNGDRLVLSDAGIEIEPGAVSAGRIYLDTRPQVVAVEVLRDRRQLAEEGLVVVSVRPRARPPEVSVVVRGVAAPDAELSEEVTRAARVVLARASAEELADPEWLSTEMTIAAKRACRRVFGLRPVIVPVVT